MTKVHNIHELTNRRRKLRKNPTPQEEKLWWYLRDKRLGVKFRRQHSVEGYILDFVCRKNNLIIEIDGGIHNLKENKEYDNVRNKFFEELGYSILRFSNAEVEENIKIVIEKIKDRLE